jgi:hypothetical protein
VSVIPRCLVHYIIYSIDPKVSQTDYRMWNKSLTLQDRTQVVSTPASYSETLSLKLGAETDILLSFIFFFIYFFFFLWFVPFPVYPIQSTLPFDAT